MGKDKPLGGKAAAAKEAKDKAAVAAAKEKGVEMCVPEAAKKLCDIGLIWQSNMATKQLDCSY